MTAIYMARHRADTGLGDLSLLVRVTHDQANAQRAVQVLAATDTLPSSRTLYREMHRAGVLMPNATHCATVLAADIIARETAAVAA
jgi:hypothetical protein